MKLYKYLGETGGSEFERSKEHVRYREKWKVSSHHAKAQITMQMTQWAIAF